MIRIDAHMNENSLMLKFLDMEKLPFFKRLFISLPCLKNKASAMQRPSFIPFFLFVFLNAMASSLPSAQGCTSHGDAHR